MRLKALKVGGIRGIPAGWSDGLPIRPGGLIVCGANGGGKSSLVDAIEYAITGRSSLFAQNRRGVSWDVAAPHINGGSPQAVCLIENSEGTASLSAGATVSEANVAPVDPWVESAKRATFVLRRYMLLNFVDAEPAQRYSQIEFFLNMEDYVRLENRIGMWHGELLTLRGEQETERVQVERQIRSVFSLPSSEPVSNPRLLQSVANAARILGLSEPTAIGEADALLQEIEKQLGGEAVSQRLAQLTALRTRLQRLPSIRDLLPLVRQLAEAVEAFDRMTAERVGPTLTELLESALSIIQDHDMNQCPVCEATIDRSSLLSRLQERIDLDRDFTLARRLVSQRRELLSKKLQDAVRELAEFQDDWVAQFGELPRVLPENQEILGALFTMVSERKEAANELRQSISRIEGSHDFEGDCKAAIDSKIAEEGSNERRMLLQSLKVMLVDGEAYRISYLKGSHTLERIESDIDQLALLRSEIETARKETAQAIIDEVAEIANRYYAALHPNENIGDTQLSVRGAVRASLELTTSFHGRNESPLLHHSESHLDTLGLCYFLAIRRVQAQRDARFKLLILDDILHSVDAEHRRRFAELLRSEFADHQIVLTTHDPTFYRILREVLGGSRFEYVLITGWDLDRGPLLSDPATDIDRITSREFREAASPEVLASSCGRFLEMLCRRLTERLQINVPAKFEGRYTINDLWPPLSAKLSKRTSFCTAQGTAIAQVNSNLYVRNESGAHHNEPPVDPSPAEVRALAEGLAGIYEVAHCQECGHFISRQANRVWKCVCDRLEYLPD